MLLGARCAPKNSESLPAWGVWIEILEYEQRVGCSQRSLPAWGVWIEMPVGMLWGNTGGVAPRMGSVD